IARLPCPRSRSAYAKWAGRALAILSKSRYLTKLMNFTRHGSPCRSPLLVRVKDVVFCLHGQMARVPAVGFGRVGRHLAGRGVMVEKRISPAPGVRKSLAVLLD